MSQTKAQLISDLVQALNFTGTASAPANGLFLSEANKLAFATASTERLKLAGSEVVVNETGANTDFRVEGDTNINLLFCDAGNDRVGIGINNPATALSVGGVIKSNVDANDGTSTAIRTENGGTGTTIASYGFASGNSQKASIRAHVLGNGAMMFHNNNDTEKMRIDASGRVLIGTTTEGFSEGDDLTINSADHGGITVRTPTNKEGNLAFSDTTSGIGEYSGLIRYRHSSDDLGLWTASNLRLLINSSGKVGIGLTTPQAVLHVEGGSEGNLIQLSNTHTGATNSDGFVFGINSSLTYLYNRENKAIAFGTNNTERMRIDSSGDIFIGTSTDIAPVNGTNLCVSDGTVARLILEKQSTRKFEIGVQDFINIYDQTADAERLRIDSSGNVGIGTSSPDDLFEVSSTTADKRLLLTKASSGTANQAGMTLHFQNFGPAATGRNDGTLIGRVRFSCSQPTSGGLQDAGAIECRADGTQTGNNTRSRLSFLTVDSQTATERMRIDKDGKVLIGVTSSSYKLHVDAASLAAEISVDNDSSNYLVALNTTNSVNADFNIQHKTSLTSIGTGVNVPLCFHINGGTNANSAEKMRLDTSGNVLIGATSSEDTTGNSGPKLLHTGDVQIDGDQKSLLFRSTNSTAQKQSGIQWWNENGAGVQCAIFGVREAVSQAPTALAFYTSDNVDTNANGGQGNISNRALINSVGEFRVQHENTSNNVVSSDQVHGIGNSALNSVTSNLARLCMQERQGDWISFRDGSGTHYGTISRSGSNVVYGGQSSDYRIKENIVNVSNGITLLKQLRPVNFNYTSDSGFTTEEQATVRIGFIAHEYAEVCPTGVIGEKDGMDIWGDCTDSEGKLTQKHVPESKKVDGETWTEKSRTPNYQQVDFSKAVPVLTAALQEAISKIETLETKVAALEAA